MPTPTESAAIGWSSLALNLTLAATAASALALVVLHFLSREFEPSWRMVSEYALGKHAWLLTLVFLAWGLAYFTLTAALLPLGATWLGRLGLLFLVLAGLGSVMGGLFDVKHKLHGAAFAIGVPSLTIGAILVTVALRRLGVELSMWPAHLSWISVAVMAIAMGMFFAAMSRAGVDMSKTSGMLEQLPHGVKAYHGWANRLLFATSYLWLLCTAATLSKNT